MIPLLLLLLLLLLRTNHSLGSQGGLDEISDSDGADVGGLQREKQWAEAEAAVAMSRVQMQRV